MPEEQSRLEQIFNELVGYINKFARDYIENNGAQRYVPGNEVQSQELYSAIKSATVKFLSDEDITAELPDEFYDFLFSISRYYVLGNSNGVDRLMRKRREQMLAILYEAAPDLDTTGSIHLSRQGSAEIQAEIVAWVEDQIPSLDRTSDEPINRIIQIADELCDHFGVSGIRRGRIGNPVYAIIRLIIHLHLLKAVATTLKSLNPIPRPRNIPSDTSVRDSSSYREFMHVYDSSNPNIRGTSSFAEFYFVVTRSERLYHDVLQKIENLISQCEGVYTDFMNGAVQAIKNGVSQ